MQIRDTSTRYRLEVEEDESGSIRFVIRWSAPYRNGPSADEEDQLAWLLRELRRLDAPAVLVGPTGK